jgi:hypothetical protein
MSRSLNAALVTEMNAAGLAPATFAFLDFQGGAVRVWDGVGSKTWGGDTYTGLGYLGTISPVEESADVRANGIILQVSGVPSALIATVLGDNYNRRDVTVWVGALNATGALVADPDVAFSGRMNNIDFDKGAETAVLRISAESRLVDLLRPRERRYTHEQQQIDFAGDLGLEYMPRAQSTAFVWGAQRAPTFAGTGGGGGAGGDQLE